LFKRLHGPCNQYWQEESTITEQSHPPPEIPTKVIDQQLR
jgi:hypothetical protein